MCRSLTKSFVLPASLLAAIIGCGSSPDSTSDDGGDLLLSADGAPRVDGARVLDDAGVPVNSPMSVSPGDGGHTDDARGSADSGGVTGGSDGGHPVGAPITCPGPGVPRANGGTCGSERWSVKVGTDSRSGSVGLVPEANTIATLAGLAAAGGGTTRETPTETTLWELKDVTMTMIKLESDSDYHIVLSDGSRTLIAEVPSPGCASSSPWRCFISRARSEIDSMFTVGSSPQYPALTVTVRGVGFFDVLHGQTGVAPNGIELHPVLQICFGRGCTPS